MYRITAEATIDAPLEQVWEVATDIAAWPAWDPHEEAATFDGPFVDGARAWSKPRGGPATWWTITGVTPQSQWGSSCSLPGGALTGVNTFTVVDAGRVRCRKQIDVTGPLTPLFRLWFGPRMRRDMARSIAALETRARSVAAGGR